MRLKEIVMIQTGVYAKESPNPNIGYIKLSDIDANNQLQSWLVPSVQIKENVEKYLLRERDLIMVAKGTSNKCIVMPKTDFKCVASPTFFVLRVLNTEEVLPEYLCWLLNTNTMQTACKQLIRGTSLPSISKLALGELDVYIPSIEKQTAYMKIIKLQAVEQQLSTELNEKINQVLESNIINNQL